MAARLGWADAVAGAPSYVGRALRQMSSVFLGGATAARPLGARSGVRPGTPTTIATATSTTWTVTPFAGVIDLQTAAIAGPYQFAFDTNQTGVVTAAGGAARTDLLFVRVNDAAEGDGTAGAPFVEIGYQAGNLTPPARSFALAQINVPASGGGAPTTIWLAPYTVAAGGIQPVNAGGYPASPYIGQHVDDPALGLVRFNGALWIPVGNYTEAAGTLAAGSSVGSNNIVFPANRFTVPPIVNVTPLNIPVGAIMGVTAKTATGMTITFSNSGGFVNGVGFDWTARQMTATTAAG